MRSLFDYGDVCNLLFKIFFFLSARDAKVLGKGIFKGPKDKYGSRSKQSQGLVGLRYDLFNSKVIIIISLRDTQAPPPPGLSCILGRRRASPCALTTSPTSVPILCSCEQRMLGVLNLNTKTESSQSIRIYSDRPHTFVPQITRLPLFSAVLYRSLECREASSSSQSCTWRCLLGRIRIHHFIHLDPREYFHYEGAA